METAYAIPLQKTHELSFELKQVCYPWHRWYGQTILTRRAGGAHADVAYFCKLPDAPFDAMLTEIPKWMFDAAHCAPMCLVDDPHVDCATLRTLKSAVSEQRVSLNAAVLQPQVSRQAGDGDADDTSPAHRITQLALFGEQPAVPSWNDLNESMRNDAVKLLARLLLSVRTSTLVCSPRKQGGRDE